MLASLVLFWAPQTPTKFEKIAARVMACKAAKVSAFLNPITLVKASNTLVGLTKSEAQQVFKVLLKESPTDVWLYHVARTFFVPVNTGWDDIGWWTFAWKPKKGKYQSINFDSGYPIMVGADERDSDSERIIDYLVRTGGSYRVRNTKLSLPNDPFATFRLPKGAEEWAGDLDWRNWARGEVLTMVRTVVAVDPLTLWDGGQQVFEAAHQKFLKAGGKWDPKLQLYVKRDGTYNKM